MGQVIFVSLWWGGNEWFWQNYIFVGDVFYILRWANLIALEKFRVKGRVEVKGPIWVGFGGFLVREYMKGSP